MKNAIPRRATFELGDRQYVYVVGKDDVVHARDRRPARIRWQLCHQKRDFRAVGRNSVRRLERNAVPIDAESEK
jgi:hypothetical protein